jgi:hypothetical protein
MCNSGACLPHAATCRLVEDHDWAIPRYRRCRDRKENVRPEHGPYGCQKSIGARDVPLFFVRNSYCPKPPVDEETPDLAAIHDFVVVLPVRVASFVSKLLRGSSGGWQGSAFRHGRGQNLKGQRYRSGGLWISVLTSND